MYQGEVKFIPPCLNFFEVIILMGHVELQNYSSRGKNWDRPNSTPPPFPRITVRVLQLHVGHMMNVDVVTS